MDTSKPSQPKGKRPALKDRSDALARHAFWISLSAKDDAKPFGSVRGGETLLNARGKALAACWRELADQRPALEPDAIVIGPRRLQGILLFSPDSRETDDLAEAIRLFKVMSALRLAQLGPATRNTPATGNNRVTSRSRRAVPAPETVRRAPPALWKKGFSEKLISGAAELAELRRALKGAQAR